GICGGCGGAGSLSKRHDGLQPHEGVSESCCTRRFDMPQTVEVPPVQGAASKPRRKPPVMKLKAERVQEELAAMGWKADPAVRTFARALKFPAARGAGADAVYVSELAEKSGQPCSVTQSGKQVTVTLLSRSRKGRMGGWSKAVLAFAKRLAACGRRAQSMPKASFVDRMGEWEYLTPRVPANQPDLENLQEVREQLEAEMAGAK